jgi:hypothetical protein
VFELPVDPAPERFVGDISAAGATLLSVNPLRDTLEDFFVKQVTAPELAAHDRGLGGAVVWGTLDDSIDWGHRAERLPRVGSRQGALQPGVLRNRTDGARRT